MSFPGSDADHDPLAIAYAGPSGIQPAAGKRRSNRNSGINEGGQPPKRTRTGRFGKETASEVPADDADGEHSNPKLHLMAPCLTAPGQISFENE